MSKVYLNGLNGIRAIAALAVIFSHTLLSLKFLGLDFLIFGKDIDGSIKGWDLAGFGVTIFFTLSGFLITFLLLKEECFKTKINIKNFYIRRLFRIWPLYFIFLILSLVTLFLFKIDYNKNLIWYYLFFLPNIPFAKGEVIPIISHFWSIGVEEQFYLFWPFVFFLKMRSRLKLIILLVFILLFIKFIFYFLLDYHFVNIFLGVTRFQCMIIGGIGGYLLFRENYFFLNLFTNKYIQLLTLIIFTTICFNSFHLISIIDHEIIGVFSLVLIIGQVKNKGLINLERPFFNYLGKISFGLYVYHPIIIFFTLKIFQSLFFNSKVSGQLISIFYFTSIVFTTICVSHISYKYLEFPFLKIKKKKYSPLYNN